MTASRKTALVLLCAINLFTVLKFFQYPCDYELLFWLVASAPFLVFRRGRPPVSRRNREGIFLYTVVFTGLYLVAWWGTGYIDGFGHSPFSRLPVGILKNIGRFGGIAAAKELSRAYALKGRRIISNWIIFLSALTFFLYDFNFNKVYTAFSCSAPIFPYLGGSFLPAVVGAAFLTRLSLAAGPLPGMIYRVVPEVAMYILPVLPKSSWQTNMLLGAALPMAAMMVMQPLLETRKVVKSTKNNRFRKPAGPAAWIVLTVSLGFMFSFSLGLLPYRPMVVLTGSMLPVIRPGDMLILQQNPDVESLRVGDIVAYKTEKYQIVHRILAIQPDGCENTYVFKGDNNDTPDKEPVTEAQIKGKVVQVIPYAGLFALTVRTSFTPEDLPVQTGGT